MKLRTIVKKGIAVGLAGAMAFGLAACGGSSSEETPSTAASSGDDSAASSNAGVTIEFQQWWGDELPDGYLDGICSDFEEETGIHVELLTAPWADTKTAITSGAATGTVADIVGVDSAWLVDFADQGIITNMSDLFDSTGFDTSLLADQWQVDGSTYAIPLLNFGYPLYVNMDILEASGVEAIPTTWTELEDACKKITAAGYEAFPINLGTQSPNGICNVVMGMASASGITMKSDDGTYNLTENADLQEFLEFIKTLWDDGSIASGATSLEESQMTSNFTAGNYAFCIASMSMLSDYTDAGLNVECAKIPVKDGYTGSSGMCVASWACGISENSENKEAAAQFLEYLFSANDGAICADMAVQKSAFPSSTKADPDYSAMPEQFQAVYEVYSEGYPENQFIGIPETETVETNMTNSLVKYLQGDIDSATLLSEMQGAIDDVQK